MQTCPHCHEEIILRELPYESKWKNYRQCPYCSQYFTVDKKTKKRQAVFIVLTLISLVLTLFMYYGSSRWLVLAVISYLIIGIGLYWANKQVFLVPYEGEKRKKDT